MTDTLWLIPKTDGGPLALIVNEQGSLVLCDECPCRETLECREAVDNKVDDLLLEVDPTTQQPVWDLLDTHTCDYECAVWEYDDAQHSWSLVSRADGHLLVALTYGATVASTAEGGATLLTYAKTLINLQTGSRRTIGCQCAITQYVCKHRMVTLDDTDIAGQLAVWEPAAGETYQPSDGCRVDTCELLKLKLNTAQQWHGGTLMGEGYYDWLLTPQQWESANYRYQPFLQAVRWTDSILGDTLTYLTCDCDGIYTHNLASGETCLEYAGICTLQDPCIALMLLHNKAEANGWTWHDEGVLVRKTSAAYPCYRFDLTTKALAAADTGSSFVYVTCSCYLSEITSDYNLYTFIPCKACDCFDVREMILNYPDLFGVSDYEFGDDTVYTRDMRPEGGSASTYSFIQSSYGWDAYWCDYRNLYVLFNNARIGIPANYDPRYVDDLIILEFDVNGNWMRNGSYLQYIYVYDRGLLYFDGKIQPFTRAQDNMNRWPYWNGPGVGKEWQGLTIRWEVENSRSYMSGEPDCSYVNTQEAADAKCAEWSSQACPYGADMFQAGTSDSIAFIPPRTSFGPSFNYTDHECTTSYDQGSGNYKVCAPYREWANNKIVFNLNFVVTNKGFLINGVSGYTDTLNVPGFTNVATQGCPGRSVQSIVDEYVNKGTATMCGDSMEGTYAPCPAGTVLELPFGAAIMSIPMYDMSFHMETRESMGGCEDDTWWDAVMNQE